MVASYDVVVIGGGPAGLAAAVSSHESGASTLLIEREDRLGGILKQCIHDGFGLERFNQRLTGPEYACKEIEKLRECGVKVFLNSFVREIKQLERGFELEIQNSKGVARVGTKSIVFAMGCRERSAKQVFIHGTRPAGVMTAGQAQFFINIQGYMPSKRAVILGSGDIGLIMARRLVLEGAEVEGVYEIKSEPSGLSRNIAQCLEDFNIPLHLSTTVTRVFGKERVEGVEVAQIDSNFKIVEGTQRYIPCDSLILSVGLIPENDMLETLGLVLDNSTKGPYVDQNMHTMLDGAFSCGNALHVNDLADFVSESGEIAGRSAALFAKGELLRGESLPVEDNGKFLYKVPQFADPCSSEDLIFYFRVKKECRNARLEVKNGDDVVFSKKYMVLRPPEMEKVIIKPEKIVHKDRSLVFNLVEANNE
ncbi:MAG: FAD-dependent oxidoreductase [Spirochaetales bacterium]|nr:FAD-dependent oxidoreductase [Spirochaetales bacterium]